MLDTHFHEMTHVTGVAKSDYAYNWDPAGMRGLSDSQRVDNADSWVDLLDGYALGDSCPCDCAEVQRICRRCGPGDPFRAELCATPGLQLGWLGPHDENGNAFTNLNDALDWMSDMHGGPAEYYFPGQSKSTLETGF